MKRTSLLIVAAVALVVAVSLGFFWPFSSGDNAMKVPGTVEVQEIHLGSKIGGRVGKVSVHEGEIVEAGKELLRFDSPELNAQRDQLQARLAGAKAELAKAENGPRPQEKTEAKAAMEAAAARNEKMQSGWREEEKRQAQFDLENYQADLDLARKSYERFEKAGTPVSQTEFDTARSHLTAAQARVNASRARFEMFTIGNRPEDKADAEATLRQMKAHSALLEAGTRDEDKQLARAQVAELEAKLREVQANLDEMVVVAPSKIVVEVLSVRKGDLVAPNTPVIRALHADDHWVKIFVPSNVLGQIHLNDSVAVACDSYPGRAFRGTVIQIATIGEFTPRNVQSADQRKHQVFAVKVRVDEDADVFKAGMAAQVSLQLKGAP